MCINPTEGNVRLHLKLQELRFHSVQYLDQVSSIHERIKGFSCSVHTIRNVKKNVDTRLCVPKLENTCVQSTKIGHWS